LAIHSQSPVSNRLPVSTFFISHISVGQHGWKYEVIFYCSFWKLFLSSLYWITNDIKHFINSYNKTNKSTNVKKCWGGGNKYNFNISAFVGFIVWFVY
jgi:hypothetical protein